MSLWPLCSVSFKVTFKVHYELYEFQSCLPQSKNLQYSLQNCKPKACVRSPNEIP